MLHWHLPLLAAEKQQGTAAEQHAPCVLQPANANMAAQHGIATGLPKTTQGQDVAALSMAKQLQLTQTETQPTWYVILQMPQSVSRPHPLLPVAIGNKAKNTHTPPCELHHLSLQQHCYECAQCSHLLLRCQVDEASCSWGVGLPACCSLL